MLKKLYPFLGDYKKYILYCIALVIAEVVCEITIPLFMSRIVDIGIPSGNLRYMILMGVYMIVIALFAMLFGVLNAKFSAIASQGFSTNLRKELFDKTQSFSFSNIDKFSTASLVTRMTNDITALQLSFMMSLRILTRAPIMLICALVAAISINARLSMVIVVSIVLLMIGSFFIVRMAGQLFSAVQKRLDDLNKTVQENLIAIRVVKAFVREDHEKSKFKNVNDALQSASMQAGGLAALMLPMMTLILNGTMIGIIWFGGKFVGSGVMSTGDLMRFISYITQILISVLMFSMIFVMLTRAKASAERAIEVMDTESDITDAEASTHTITQGKVEFQHVNFRYPTSNNDEYVLSDINFSTSPGEFIGILGGTGSGKSSLVNLIARFYDITEGAILIDGKDVRQYRQKNLREGIGMVMQKNNLFTGTIKENILWGNENATMEEVIQAAKDAQAHDFISSFPDGYDTELGQGGVNVSGGQKQRICIARAMLKKPAILILDDSTSAVDTATEANIRKSFYNNFKDATVFMVAQRISSIQQADKIIVLDDGKITGIGTHDELLQTNPIYKEIYYSQVEGSVAE